MFSSPIGAFIFLIILMIHLYLRHVLFSSPIGAFIFLILTLKVLRPLDLEFSSPIGAFIFLIEIKKLTNMNYEIASFRPLSGLLFS